MGKNIYRAAYLSFTVGLGLVVGLQFWPDTTQPAFGNQLISSGLASNGLITHVQEIEGRPTRVIIIDPQLRSMGVYDISRENGEIQLMSIRSLNADLRMLKFNSGGISPEDIQKAIERQQ